MSAPKHTPGPFSLEVRPDWNIDIGPLESGSVNPLATVYGDDNDPECWPVTANAKLFAAAPDFAEVVAEYVAEVDRDGFPSREWSDANLAKMRAALRRLQ